MSKWADYLISGVWFEEDENIKHVSSVLLHEDNDKTVAKGKKASRSFTVQLIEEGYTVKTIRWNYSNRKWSEGAFVEIYHLKGKKYLRTNADATTSDNLDNMLPMASLSNE